MSARKKVNQSRPRALPADAADRAAGIVCCTGTNDVGASPARRSSEPPANSAAMVNSPLSPAPSGLYGVGFRPIAMRIGRPSSLQRVRVPSRDLTSQDLMSRSLLTQDLIGSVWRTALAHHQMPKGGDFEKRARV